MPFVQEYHDRLKTISHALLAPLRYGHFNTTSKMDSEGYVDFSHILTLPPMAELNVQPEELQDIGSGGGSRKNDPHFASKNKKYLGKK